MYSTALTAGVAVLLGAVAATGTSVDSSVLDACPGYTASHVEVNGATLSADLALAGTECNVFGADIKRLSLKVVYETSMSQHHSTLIHSLMIPDH